MRHRDGLDRVLANQREYQRERNQEDKEIIRSTYKALVTDPGVDWVRYSHNNNSIGEEHHRELWIPSVHRWVRIRDCAISGVGRYVYPNWFWRFLFRRAIAAKGLPRE